ncbi:MAG TPA: hypothetical protein VIT42_16950 [Microlunatus sp.]
MGIRDHPRDLAHLRVGVLGDADKQLPGLVGGTAETVRQQPDGSTDRPLTTDRDLEVPDVTLEGGLSLLWRVTGQRVDRERLIIGMHTCH